VDNLSEYERKQLDQITKWKAEEPGVISQAFGLVMEPMAWLIRKVVPQSAIKAVLDFANSSAEWLADTNDIKRDGDVQKISDLQTKDLRLSDKLADEVHNWAIGIAVAEGAAAGAGGIFTAPIDIPAILTIALRTIHKIGLCYGYECQDKVDKDFVLAIMAASGANSMEEKVAALSVLKSLEVMLIKQTWKSMAEKAAQQQMGKEAAIIGLRNLAKQLGVNITKRRALASIPAIGALIGGSVNGWYIKEVGWAARRAFQERWLIENDKLVDI
jgi:hypothetical protein